MPTIPSKPLIGIILYPIATTHLRNVQQTDRYGFKIGEHAPGMHQKGLFFISTPAIREKIAELHLRPGHEVGRFDYVISHEFKFIALNWDYPTSEEWRLSKLGIGSMAENILEKKYAKLFPTYHATGTYDDNGLRRAQLRKRGRVPGEAIPIQKARDLTRKYVVRKHQEWMKKNRRPPLRH